MFHYEGSEIRVKSKTKDAPTTKLKESLLSSSQLLAFRQSSPIHDTEDLDPDKYPNKSSFAESRICTSTPFDLDFDRHLNYSEIPSEISQRIPSQDSSFGLFHNESEVGTASVAAWTLARENSVDSRSTNTSSSEQLPAQSASASH